MTFHRDYYLEDFRDHANENCPDEFAALSTSPSWVIEYKTVRNGANKLCRLPMMLVGRPFYHHGIQSAWAHANGTSIEYYYAHRHDEIVTTLGDLFTNKVYFGDPLTYISGYQDTSHGMTKSRRTGRALAELVINFIFLLQGELVSFRNPGNTDLLSDFEYACRIYAMRREEDMINMGAEYMPYYANKHFQSQARGSGSRDSAPSGYSTSSSKIKRECDDDDDAPAPSIFSIPAYSSTAASSGRPASTKSYDPSTGSSPSVRIKKEPDDADAHCVYLSGTSNSSAASKTSSSRYRGMFAMATSSGSQRSAPSSNPFRLSTSSGSSTSSSSVSTKSIHSSRQLIAEFSFRSPVDIYIPDSPPSHQCIETHTNLAAKPHLWLPRPF
ncbi:hypothetical protein IQ06DRAFT_111321 [Phaeosphaeriaceae sp. SRC1lsM3a]|nr:hypothetical protein IQ06DRAFT_111321 [Stagonospora sp. SRC1lsM3a]